jgi:hypothetical protein
MVVNGCQWLRLHSLERFSSLQALKSVCFSYHFTDYLSLGVKEYAVRYMIYSIYISLLNYGTLNAAGFVKELLIIAILLISPIYKKVIFASFF